MRNWLLFYSLPVLNGVLPNPYLSHYSLLVAGLLLLTSDRITPDDIRNAELYLNEFYVKFPELYGQCEYNYPPVPLHTRREREGTPIHTFVYSLHPPPPHTQISLSLSAP